MEQKLNRIKVMLVEKGKNGAQPTLATMMKIAQLLECNLDDLVRFEALEEE